MADETSRSSEFEALGRDGVRAAVKSGCWPKEKAAAAKYWLQLEDVKRWHETSPSGQPSSRDRFRSWGKYLVTAIALLFAAMRLFRLMRHGV